MTREAVQGVRADFAALAFLGGSAGGGVNHGQVSSHGQERENQQDREQLASARRV